MQYMKSEDWLGNESAMRQTFFRGKIIGTTIKGLISHLPVFYPAPCQQKNPHPALNSFPGDTQVVFIEQLGVGQAMH